MKVSIAGHNIVSPLGFTTEENMAAIRSGKSGIVPCGYYMEVAEPVSASVLDNELIEQKARLLGIVPQSYTRFEQLAILSIADAAKEDLGQLSDKQTLFILSTTKGNIDLLEANPHSFDKDRLYLWRSAQIIADYFGNPNKPIVVSNACISGVAAQVVAYRFLQSGAYKKVVVVGADILSKFVISGFQSFKALSPERCRPFDTDRCGLNIGEGAATLILESLATGDTEDSHSVLWEAGAITNDANHISGPSRTGEGLYQALLQAIDDCPIENIGFLNAHGTATPYNDEMEAIAFQRAGLTDIPVFSLKGYFGHTLGASGVIETIVSACSLQDGILPVSLGYESCGVSAPLRVVTQAEQGPYRQCIKTASGFGGCNAAIRLKKEGLC